VVQEGVVQEVTETHRQHHQLPVQPIQVVGEVEVETLLVPLVVQVS
jgi:hypothetical protein